MIQDKRVAMALVENKYDDGMSWTIDFIWYVFINQLLIVKQEKKVS